MTELKEAIDERLSVLPELDLHDDLRRELEA